MTFAEIMSYLKEIETTIERNEKEMDIIEKRIGYVPNEILNKKYSEVKNMIDVVDKNKILCELFLEYECEFPFKYDSKIFNSYKDIAKYIMN